LINEDIESEADETEPLTTILAIKCPNGIVLASDSQATEGKMKTLGVTKIFLLNDFIALGGSGDAYNIRLFMDAVKQEFTQISATETEFREKIQNLTWRLHKKYNTDAKEFWEKTRIPSILI
jgi:proteasome beta subunit